MSNLDNRVEIRDIVCRISDGLDIHSLGAIIDGSSNLVGVVSVDKLGGDAETRKEDLELVVGAAIEVARGYDIVAGLGESGQGQELGCLS